MLDLLTLNENQLPDKSTQNVFDTSEGDRTHAPHILTLLNKYVISTLFAKKFLT